MHEVQGPVDDPAELRGLHLFHADFSNCSQRVRWALAEKQLVWISHRIDLVQGDHLEDWYQRLNPGGVVPTLVDNGLVVTNSNAIIEYLDRTYPLPRLGPRNDAEAHALESWFELVSKAQLCIKTLTFERLLVSRRTAARERLNHYRARQRNRQLVAFMEEFCSDGGIAQDKVRACEEEARTLFEHLDGLTGRSRYLLGDDFSLADIAVGVNVERLLLIGMPMVRFWHLTAWYGRIVARPAFRASVSQPAV